MSGARHTSARAVLHTLQRAPQPMPPQTSAHASLRTSLATPLQNSQPTWQQIPQQTSQRTLQPAPLRISQPPARRALIVTADDFGLHQRVNAAVERAHCDGVLRAASLMVGAPAARDAVARARALPLLRVGLHLVLADGDALAPPAQIAALLDANGRFGGNMVRDGVRFFLLPQVRRQLAREIRAQFDAFAATGLTLDHVNTHKHFHLHPTVLGLILDIGRDYGMNAMRLPFEVNAPLWLRPWLAQVRTRLARAGIAHNDYVVGIAASGRMDEAAWLAALADLPDGVGEIYCHPALAGAALSDGMRGYRHADELQALLSPRVAAAIDALGARVGGFADVFA